MQQKWGYYWLNKYNQKEIKDPNKERNVDIYTAPFCIMYHVFDVIGFQTEEALYRTGSLLLEGHTHTCM